MGTKILTLSRFTEELETFRILAVAVITRSNSNNAADLITMVLVI
jgi:hypothetical protein